LKLESDVLEKVLDLSLDLTTRCIVAADWERAERWADMTWVVMESLGERQ
jgi:hypothetical protein